MEPVWNFDPNFQAGLKEWLELMIWDGQLELSDCQIMAVVEGRDVKAGVAFHDWQPHAGVIEISGASNSKKWLTRPVLMAIFSYVFIDLKCQLCVARIDPDNHSLLRIFKAYGFNDYRIPRLMGRDKDQIIVTLTDDAWRSNRFMKGLNRG